MTRRVILIFHAETGGSSSSSIQEKSSTSVSAPSATSSASPQQQVTAGSSQYFQIVKDENLVDEPQERVLVDDIREHCVTEENKSAEVTLGSLNIDEEEGDNVSGTENLVKGIGGFSAVETGTLNPPLQPVPPTKLPFSMNSSSRRFTSGDSNTSLGPSRRGGGWSGVSSRSLPTVSRPSLPGSQEGKGYNSSNEQHRCSYDEPERERQFKKGLRRVKGLEMRKMVEDGNCLFRAVADQVYGDSELYDLVREMCVDYMEQERDRFSQFIIEGFPSYCKSKRRDKVCGNVIEIQALSEMYNRPIHIYAYSTEPVNIVQGSCNTDKPPILLSYHYGNYFNSLVDPRRLTVGAIPLFIFPQGENIDKDQVKAGTKAQQDDKNVEDDKGQAQAGTKSSATPQQQFTTSTFQYVQIVKDENLVELQEQILVDELPEHCRIEDNKSEKAPAPHVENSSSRRFASDDSNTTRIGPSGRFASDNSSRSLLTGSPPSSPRAYEGEGYFSIDELSPLFSPSHNSASALLVFLLGKMESLSEMDVEVASTVLRVLMTNPSLQTLFIQIPNSIPQMLCPLITCKAMTPYPVLPDLDLQENIISILFSISLPHGNKKLVAETPLVITILIDGLKFGTEDTSIAAVAAFRTLAKLESNKELIAKSCAVESMIMLLGSLSSGSSHGMLLDILLYLLDDISSNRKCLKQLGEAIPFLCDVIKSNFCEENIEYCMSLLHSIAFSDRSKLEAMREVKSMFHMVAESGTSRARRKARRILGAF